LGELRQTLARGDRAVGSMVFEFFVPGIAQLAVTAGADFLIYDMEHSGAGIENIKAQMSYCRGLPITPIVRVPGSEYHFVARILDCGAKGVMVPMVESAEQILSAAYAENDQLIEDIKEARLALEVAMVRKAATVATAEDLRRLREALERNRRAISSRDEFLASDIAFHRTIASITGNRIFEEASALVLEWLARFRTDMVHVEGANLVSYDEHAAIAKGIVERDPEQAADAMRRHQLRTHAIYRALAPAPRPPSDAVGLG
jgi:citrate lyase beta subunit